MKIEFNSPDTYRIKNIELGGAQMGELAAMAEIQEDDDRQGVQFYYAPGISSWVVIVGGERMELSRQEVAEIVNFRSSL